MLQDRRQFLALLAAGCLSGTWSAMTPAFAKDQVPLPPGEEIFVSPSDRFRLHLLAAPDWTKDRPQAALAAVAAGREEVLWRRELPQELRPRLALVSDEGRVLLLDEWWNTRSGYAVMLLAPDGSEVARHGFEQVVAALGVTVAELDAEARLGRWISAPPRIAGEGRAARVAAGGKALLVDLESGALSAGPAD
jgi:hypothetical protein